jgi:hypothetical protein
MELVQVLAKCFGIRVSVVHPVRGKRQNRMGDRGLRNRQRADLFPPIPGAMVFARPQLTVVTINLSPEN